MTEVLLIFMAWSAYLVLFLNVGVAFSGLLGLNPSGDRPLFATVLRVFSGMAVVTAFFGVLSLWFPINAYVGIPLMVCSLMLFAMPQVRIGWKELFSGVGGLGVATKLLLTLFFALLLFSSWLPSLNYDTGLYHNQFIKWINSYPVVPGLANLHGRFGFNSHWHLLEAGMNGVPFLARPLNDLAGFITLVLLLASVEGIQKIIKKESRFADLLLALFVFPLYLLCRFFTSDTPDLPNAIIGFLVLVIPFHFPKKHRLLLLYVVIIGSFLSTIKITAVFALLVALPAFLRTDLKTKGLAIMLGLMLMAPWLIRNHIQTGYLVFPAKFTAISTPDYQVPEPHMDYMNVLLEVHGQFGRYAVEMSEATLDQWVSNWFGFQTRFVQMMLIFCPVLLLLLLFWDLYRIKDKGLEEVEIHLMVHLMMLLTFVVWFSKGPNPRYIYGAFIFYFVYALLRIGVQRFRYAQLAIIVLGVALFLKMTNTIRNEPSADIRPTGYAFIETGTMSIPYPTDHDQCWNHELPCASKKVIRLQMRGADLSDGFRIGKEAE